nr:hypothetical protein Iba_chr09aCG0740 [Ipomoea batatas]
MMDPLPSQVLLHLMWQYPDWLGILQVLCSLATKHRCEPCFQFLGLYFQAAPLQQLLSNQANQSVLG